jgi:hypothetical protein
MYYHASQAEFPNIYIDYYNQIRSDVKSLSRAYSIKKISHQQSHIFLQHGEDYM